jgi:hypothetical protein
MAKWRWLRRRRLRRYEPCHRPSDKRIITDRITAKRGARLLAGCQDSPHRPLPERLVTTQR